MLAGSHAMDEHFRSAPLERNLPALMGLLGSGTLTLIHATHEPLASQTSEMDCVLARPLGAFSRDIRLANPLNQPA